MRAGPEKAAQLAELVGIVWPEHSPEELTQIVEEYLGSDESAVFYACVDGQAAGVALCALRHDYVEGCETSPVGYLEGVAVREACRHQGVARTLLSECEQWARDKGCTEFASDCELTNSASLRFHLSVGFREENRIICFKKMLFSYRKANAADADRINELFVEMLKTIYRTDEVKGYADGYLDKFFSGGEDRIYVAEAGKDIVAFLSVEVYRVEKYIYLDDLSVTERHRGRGIGTALIRMAEEYAGSIGISRIAFHVEEANRDAHRLYVILGYHDDVMQGTRIRMIKSLDGQAAVPVC